MNTTLSGRHPFSDLAELRDRLDRIFETGEVDRSSWSPRIDLVAEDQRLILKADLPGVTPDDVEIEVEDGVLRVSGRHEERSEEEDRNYIRRERRVGAFYRSVGLPKEVDPEKIEAVCKDGVLEVTVPIPERADVPAKVEIKSPAE